MKVKVLAVIMSVLLLGLMLCACGSADAKAAYKPPARVFDVEIEGTNEPKIDGVEITYDSKARIDTVSYSIDGYDYKQEYSYDTDQIVIKTIYKTEVIEEKVIKYVEIPVTSGFAEVDGYIVRVTEDMPVNDSGINENSGTESSDTEETIAATIVNYDDLVETASEGSNQYGEVFRIPKIKLDSSDASNVNNEIQQEYAKYLDGNNYGLVQLDYTYYLYEGLLSVVIGSQGEGGGYVHYSVYTFDVESGKKIDNDGLRKHFSLSDSQVIDKLRNAEDNHFSEMFDSNWNDSIITTYNNAYEGTVAEKNLSNYSLFIGSKGLMAVINEYTMAGQGNSEVAVDLENERVYRYFSTLLEEY